MRDLGKLGDLLDKVTVAGANRIEGIAFIVSNQDGLLDEARRKAVADAKDKADLYAKAAGFTLGKVMSLTEESAPSPRRWRAAMTAVAAAPVPVEAGEMTLSVRVRWSGAWRIKAWARKSNLQEPKPSAQAFRAQDFGVQDFGNPRP